MASYRSFLRESPAGFDGTTPEDYTVLPNGDTQTIYSQVGFVYTTTVDTVVGKWSPPSLGRNAVASLAKINSNELTDPTDTIDIYSFQDALIRSLPLSVPGTNWIFLNADDYITITSSTTHSVNILIVDLTWDQLMNYIQAQTIAAALFNSSIEGTPVTSADNIPIFAVVSGKFTPIEMTGGAGQTLTLPPASGVTVGTSVLVWNNSASAHNILPTGAGEINGINAPFVSGAGTRTLIYGCGPNIQWLTK